MQIGEEVYAHLVASGGMVAHLAQGEKHVESVLALTEDDRELAGHILCKVVPQLAKELGIDENGFRLVANTGKDGQQTVKHLHFHLIGGRSMQWPPG